MSGATRRRRQASDRQSPIVFGAVDAAEIVAFLRDYVANKSCDLNGGFITQCWHCDAKALIARAEGRAS